MDKVKQCSKCKEWKELSEFGKLSSSKDGYKFECKECRKLYYEKNKFHIKNKNKEYRENNKETIKIYQKNRRKNNKDKIKIYQKKYNKKNKENIFNQRKEYRENNKEQIKKMKKVYSNSFVLWNSVYPENIKPYEEIRQNNEFLEVKCAYCGKWYIPIIQEIHHRLSAINGTSVGENRLYCSDGCKKECPIYGQNKYPKGFKKATSREVQPELRQLVLLRDNYTCQKCEKHQDELKIGLHCHHYEGIEINPIESADIDNCITLCKKCHKEVHKLPGCGYNDMKCENN